MTSHKSLLDLIYSYPLVALALLFIIYGALRVVVYNKMENVDKKLKTFNTGFLIFAVLYFILSILLAIINSNL